MTFKVLNTLLTSPPTAIEESNQLRRMKTLCEIPKSRYASQLAATVIPIGRARKLLLSHVEVYKMVENVATSLRECGVRPGTVCAMICPISLEAVVYFLALMWIGAVAAPVDPNLPWECMRDYLKEMQAFCVVSPYIDDDERKDDDLWHKVEKAARHLDLLNWHIYRTTNQGVLVDMHGTRADKSAAWSGGAGDFKIDPAETAVRMVANTATDCTSLENESPKALAFNHANLAAAATSFSETYQLVPEMTTVMTSALHTMEGILVLIATLYSGGHLIIPGLDHIDPEKCLQLTKTHRVKWLSCNPTLAEGLADLLKSNDSMAKDVDLSFIRCCGKMSTGTRAEEIIRDKMNVPVLTAYGFVGSANLVTASTNNAHRLGTMGKPVVRCDIAIFNPETHEILSRGQEGEIAVAGPVVSNGYINDDALNEESIIAVGNDENKSFSPKYFLTGNMGVLDEDGYLKVYGTTKEMKAQKLAELEEEEKRRKEAEAASSDAAAAALALQKQEAERKEREARELEEQKRREEEAREVAERERVERQAAKREAAKREAAEREAAEREAAEKQAFAVKEAQEQARREAKEAAAAALASTEGIAPGDVKERDLLLLKESAKNKYLDPETAHLILERLAVIEANQKKFQEDVEQRHQKQLADLQAQLDAAQRRLQENEAMSLALQKAVESANKSNQSAKEPADAVREAADAPAGQDGKEPSVVEVADPNCATRTIKVSLDDIEDAMKMHPSIAEARGFGRPDPRFGYEVYCAIKPKRGARVSEAWLKLHAQSVLPAACVPKKFFLVETLERDTNRHELARDETLKPIVAKKTRSKPKVIKPPAWKPVNSNSYAGSHIFT